MGLQIQLGVDASRMDCRPCVTHVLYAVHTLSFEGRSPRRPESAYYPFFRTLKEECVWQLNSSNFMTLMRQSLGDPVVTPNGYGYRDSRQGHALQSKLAA